MVDEIERKRILLGYVTYYADSDAVQQIVEMSNFVDVIVFDNTPKPCAFPNLPRIKSISYGENYGIAYALNYMLDYAISMGYKFLITMDQDSTMSIDLVDTLYKSILDHPEAVLVSPIHVMNGRSYDSTMKNSEGVIQSSTVMTSGNLVNVRAAAYIGGFNTQFFIDYVDHEFCLRARSLGYQVLTDLDAKMEHALGDSKADISFLRPTNHSPLRRRYITRNRLYTWRMHSHVDRKWIIRDLARSFKEFLSIVFKENQKKEKIESITLGIFDFFRGRYGKIQ